MLATPELLRESTLPYRLGEVLPAWLREIPLYRASSGRAKSLGGLVSAQDLQVLPFISKKDIRQGFPANLLRPGADLDELLEDEIVELEHTSGTSEERTPLLLKKGWWAEQENRALRLNPVAAALLDEAPCARRVTISSPVWRTGSAG